jgi:hypothetical protein
MLHSVTSQNSEGLNSVLTEARNLAFSMHHKLKGSKNGWIPVSVPLWTRIMNELIFAFLIYILWHILVLIFLIYMYLLLLLFYFSNLRLSCVLYELRSH